MDPRTVQFHRCGEVPFPEPRPASLDPPPYLRPPFVDPYSLGARPRQAMLNAASLGYIVPLAYQAQFFMDANSQLSVQTGGLPVESQYAEQVIGSPMQGRHIPKFLNPWIVQTPPGYSSLILPPLSRFHMPFEVLAGVVETDTYYRPVHFPSLCVMQPGQFVDLPLGTPLTQLIPIRRENWRSVIDGTTIDSTASDSGTRVIRFDADSPGQLIAPQPAFRFTPEWLKRMPGEIQAMDSTDTHQTVKKCMPFLEAVVLGYLLPLEYDLELTMSGAGELSYRAGGDIVNTRVPLQYVGAPFENSVVIRLRVPWRITTPPSYSSLVLPMLNRFETPLHALPGLIDTDTDHDELVIPILCMMPPGSRIELPRGSAIAQIVPVEREPWQSAILPYDAARSDAGEQAREKNPHVYRDEHWLRKSYL